MTADTKHNFVYPLEMFVEIVDLPIKSCDFPVRCVSLPEGNYLDDSNFDPYQPLGDCEEGRIIHLSLVPNAGDFEVMHTHTVSHIWGKF